MTIAGARRLPWGMFGLVLSFVALDIVFEALDPSPTVIGDLAFLFSFLLFPVVGLALATRRPENALGWLMLVIGLVALEPVTGYGDYAAASGDPTARWALGATTWTWVPVIGLAGTFVLLLFPDGRLPSPRWRVFAWTIAIGMVVTSLVVLFLPETLVDVGHPQLANPYAIAALGPLEPFLIPFLAVIPLGILGSAWSLVVRYRRSGPAERLQIRWLASAAGALALVFAVTMAASVSIDEGWATGGGWVSVLQIIAIALFALLPISIGVSVLRYRLYDIDVVIRKTVIVAAIAILFTLLYVVVVGGVGALVGSVSTPALSFGVAAIAAVLFQPALARARRFADRIVYGKRATPYEVLAEFSDRVAQTYAADDVLARMARVVCDGVGARRADVWLKSGDQLRVAASAPPGADASTPVPLGDDAFPSLPGADAAFPVEHQGELLGALAVAMPQNDPMDEMKGKLVADLAAQAGLVLRNVRLTEDLRARLRDLQAAQKRLVTAQDEERRRLERNIHDGAQQQLVALTVKLRLAEALVERDPAKAASMIRDLQAETQAALEDLRDLARGIYPPLLADKGLVAAIESQVRKATVPVEVSPDGVTRYPPEIEAAVYFSILEAMQNVAKYAGASHVDVRLSHADGMLRFEVSDDGRGFDPEEHGYGTGLQGIADRLAALDGVLDVRSRPGGGTTVAGRLPIGAGT